MESQRLLYLFSRFSGYLDSERGAQWLFEEFWKDSLIPLLNYWDLFSILPGVKIDRERKTPIMFSREFCGLFLKTHFCRTAVITRNSCFKDFFEICRNCDWLFFVEWFLFLFRVNIQLWFTVYSSRMGGRFNNQFQVSYCQDHSHTCL